ncbi:MAG: MerR family transcriptional regulator [Sandaracinaceae bacterium]|nr:MerR family transcriptional regulator [Sandaracinaceae bacterium]
MRRDSSAEGPTASDEKLLRVGDLAKAAGKTVRALHLYEELGLLVPTDRSKGGYRLYAADSVTRVHFISKLQDMGFSLTHIGEIVRAWEASASAPSAMARMRDLYNQKLEETRAQRERLIALERELVASVAYLDTCDACDPKRLIQSCSSCDMHSCSTHVPGLVAGLHQQSTPQTNR